MPETLQKQNSNSVHLANSSQSLQWCHTAKEQWFPVIKVKQSQSIE